MRFPYLMLLAMTFALPACSSDSNKSGTTNPDTDGGSQGGSGGGGGECKLTPADFVDGGCTAPGKVFDGKCCVDKAAGEQTCKDQSVAQSPGTKIDDPTCGAGCTCGQCTQEMLDCGNDPDNYCSVILKCAQEHNCTGVACYAANTCQTVIDAAPGGGLTAYAVALATRISDCAVKANCAAACP